MKVSDFNTRITILENKTVKDKIGNHSSVWRSIFSCWANVSIKTLKEYDTNGVTVSSQTVNFMIRQNATTNQIESKKHRISLHEDIFDIEGVQRSYTDKKYIKLIGKSGGHDGC